MRVNVIAAAGALDLAGHRVHRQVGEDERALVVGVARAEGAAAHHRADPGEQLVERERLGEVVVGAGVETVDAVADRVAGGEHQDGQVVAGGAQCLGGLDAVEPRHHHVDDHRVGGEAVDPGEGLDTVIGEGDFVAVELQRAAQGVANGAVVVYDQDAHGAQPATPI